MPPERAARRRGLPGDLAAPTASWGRHHLSPPSALRHSDPRAVGTVDGVRDPSWCSWTERVGGGDASSRRCASGGRRWCILGGAARDPRIWRRLRLRTAREGRPGLGPRGRDPGHPGTLDRASVVPRQARPPFDVWSNATLAHAPKGLHTRPDLPERHVDHALVVALCRAAFRMDVLLHRSPNDPLTGLRSCRSW